MCEGFAGPALLMLTFALQARLPKEAGRGRCLGQTWDDWGDDSPDDWAIPTCDTGPSGSSEQQAQAEPDAQAASVSGVEPPPGFRRLPPRLPHHNLSHPGLQENPEQQPLPAFVSPTPGHVVVLASQQQQHAVAAAPQQQQQAVAAAPPQQQQQAAAAAAAPPLPQQQAAAAAPPQQQQQQQQQAMAAAQPPQQQQQQAMAAATPAPQQQAAQGQPAQQGEIVELSGNYFLKNRPRMLRLTQLRQTSTVEFKNWGKVDPQQEAKLARQQQREEAEAARFRRRKWSHDGFTKMWNA